MRQMKRLLILLLCLLLLCLPVAAAGEEETSASRLEAELDVPEQQKDLSLLQDGRISTYVDFKAGNRLLARVKEPPQGVYIQWQRLPGEVALAWLDEAGNTLSRETLTPAFINVYVSAPQDAMGLELTFSAKAAVCGLEFYGPGRLPDALQQWKPPMETPAYMLLCGYPGDELLYFGGLVPLCLNDGIPLSIAYISAYSRQRQEEGLEALWALGMKHYPVYLGVETGRNREVEYLRGNWRTNPGTLVEKLLLAYSPQVLLSFEEEGERLVSYKDEERKTRSMGEAQTALTGKAAVDGAAAAAKSGWQGLLLAKGMGSGTLSADMEAPLGLYADRSARETAQNIYDACYRSLAPFDFSVEERGDFTCLQGEPKGSSLFSAVDYAPLHSPVPTASPSPSPTPEPTATPAPVPAATPEQKEAPEPEEKSSSLWSRPMFWLLGGVVLGALAGSALYLLKQFKFEDMPLWLLVLVPVCIGLLCALLGARSIREMESARQAAAVVSTAAPSAAPESAPEPSPTAVPEESPLPEVPEETAQPGKWADKFLPKGAEEEITADVENGHWSYKSQTLSVEITRHADSRPLVWFVADIYMQGANAFRPAFGNEGRTGRTPLMPWKMARLNKAVLLVTGDNMLHMEADIKGAILRDGRIYSASDKGSVAAFASDRPEMDVFSARSYTAEGLLAAGYENTYAFGPILLRDGEISEEEIAKSHVGKANPRCGVGMVEPGHFVAIVVDGRRSEYSVGVTLTEFARMFKDMGCRNAFNMDGGVSACMIFMGEQLNSHGNVANYSKQRHMPDGVIFGYSEQVPSLEDPIYNDGIDTTYNIRRD